MVETPGDSGSINGPRQISLTLGGPAAGLLLLLYTLLYVLPLYASKRTRPSPTLSRDSPLVIQARITSVTVSTALCSVLTFLILSARSDDGSDSGSISPLRAMGYWPLGLWHSLRSLALVALLFAGPLYEALVVYGMWKDWTTLQPLYDIWYEWTSWRNFVVGPVTEELLFRSAAVPLLVGAGVSLGKIVFLTPIIFGLAHIHHFYEFRLTHPHVPIIAAVARSLLQLTYTTLFGAYATFIFLRTGSLLAIIIVHAFCNAMGLPRFWGHVQPYWMYPGQQPWVWTSVYYVLLVSGSVAWWWQLWPLTESGNALASW
ncbi:related to CAAX prenyl protease 2 [Cephalotrichum gorgonifer]|uniref:intramembrane prenyl-peptidase Rce1 n=1 Tax=Cephalotrichum gorgonifer TaxID=2041049 RepID=A0AAE8MSG2_9PEZI|nr:related to CAAX prenyl protease 2 [Cephalotrichum gorgonifer]